MKRTDNPQLYDTYYYKIGQLERALVELKNIVSRGNMDLGTLRLMPMQYAVLLEAARLGASQIYLHPELLERMKYPLP